MESNRLRGERVKEREMTKVKDEVAAEREERYQSWCREKIYLWQGGRQHCADWSDEPLTLNAELHADTLKKIADEQAKNGGKVIGLPPLKYF